MPALGEFLDDYQTPVRALPPTPAPVAKPAPASTTPPTTAVARTTAQPTSANTSRTLQLSNPAAATHPGTAAKAVAPTGGYWWHQTAPPPSQANKVNTKPKAITERPLEQSNAKKTATPANKIAEPIRGYEPANTHPASALGKPVRLGPDKTPLPANKGRPPDEPLADRNKPKTVTARRRTTAAKTSPAAKFNQLLASESRLTPSPTLRAIKPPRLAGPPTLGLANRRKPAFSSGFESDAFSATGRPVFGLPPNNERTAPIKPGPSAVTSVAKVIRNQVVSVSAADIKATAALPEDFIRALGYLLQHRSALLEAGVEFLSHRNKDASILETDISAIRAGSGIGKATLQASEQFARQYAFDKIHELPGELMQEALKIVFGDTAAEIGPGLIQAVTMALTAAAVAKTIKEAKDFEQDYAGALNHPAGKHFLLDLEKIVDDKPELRQVTELPKRSSLAPQTPLGASVGVGLARNLRYAYPEPGPRVAASTTMVGVRVDVNLQTFIYWWASRQGQIASVPRRRGTRWGV
jgi:hypothetical protein